MTDLDYGKLPNFMVIGAPKCGTTSLHTILGQHPQIFTTQRKEPMFFSHDRYQNGLQWYQDIHFSDAGGYLARGESSPFYLPSAKVTAPRIRESFDGHPIKFVAIFRDPVQRIYSHYWYRRRKYAEDVSFEEALASETKNERNQWNQYFQQGCYASSLEIYFQYFPRENFHLMLLDDLASDFERSMLALSQFLGVKDDFQYTMVRDNQAAIIKNRQIYSLLKDRRNPYHNLAVALGRLFPRILVKLVKDRATKSNMEQKKYAPMEPVMEAILRERYRDEVMRLEEIMGRDLSAWIKK